MMSAQGRHDFCRDLRAVVPHADHVPVVEAVVPRGSLLAVGEEEDTHWQLTGSGPCATCCTTRS